MSDILKIVAFGVMALQKTEENMIHLTSVTYLILVCGWPNVILILDFDTLKILLAKETDLLLNTLVKVKRKKSKENEDESNEELACFFGQNFKSKIVLYENKKN